MEKVNEKMITISEEKLHSINDQAYAELMVMNIAHGGNPELTRIFEANHDYGELLISIIVDSTDESEE